MKKILSTMDYLARNDTFLPQSKFNSIKERGRVIGYEFKEDELRVYCTKVSPNVLIIMGGCKNNQKRYKKT